MGHPPPQDEQCPDLQEDPHPYCVKTALSSAAGKKERGVPEKCREFHCGSRSIRETPLVFQGRVKNVIFFAMIKCCGDHQDKLNVTIRPTLVTWASFGQVQRVIKYKYRDSERPGTVPSFREFIKYLVRFILTEDDCVILISGWRTVAQLPEYEENDEDDK